MTRARENADIHDGSTAITTVGTVTAGNLANTAIVYPAGHIIKCYTGSITNNLTTNTQSWELFKSTDAVTPSTATSKFIVQMSFGIGWTQFTDATYNLRIYESDSQTTIFENQWAFHKNGGTILHYMYGLASESRGGVYTNTNTNAKTFKFQVKASSDCGTSEKISLNTYQKTGNWWIMEVQP